MTNTSKPPNPPKKHEPRPGGCVLSVLSLLALAGVQYLFPALLLLFSFNDNGDPQGAALLSALLSVNYWSTRGLQALAVVGLVWAFWPRKAATNPPSKQTPPGEDS